MYNYILKLTSISTNQCQTFWVYLKEIHSIHVVKQLNEES